MPVRFFIVSLLMLSCRTSMVAQAIDSHGKPSSLQTQAPPVAPAPTPQTPAQRPPQRAAVTLLHGQLKVTADNSSLNEILREISRETGIKIVGGVADERVFGVYGPSAASEVLASLLEGTGSNVLLLQRDSTSPGELILTPRQGGVTPPNLSAQGFEDDASDNADPPSPPLPPEGFHLPPVINKQPLPLSDSSTPQAATSNQPTSSAPAADTTDPNAVKTPQQIFEQLQKLRQQQQPK